MPWTTARFWLGAPKHTAAASVLSKEVSALPLWTGLPSDSDACSTIVAWPAQSLIASDASIFFWRVAALRLSGPPFFVRSSSAI